MHPILFRIPLPNRPLMLWWALAVVIGIAALYAIMALRKKDMSTVWTSLAIAALAGGAIYKWKHVSYQAPNLPIFSYGVMLGLSLIVGWYVTLPLCDRDKLPRETMANCYVITAFAALAGARLLYVLNNPDDFKEFADIFALRKGGYVAYGGFLGGFLGSWGYLASKRIRLLPWADAAVPSLASGLLITRIGCYLFGCDFGMRLSDGAPGWLKKLGSFPHWGEGTLDFGAAGSPAYLRHVSMYPVGAEHETLLSTNHSLPVHPTQLYESLTGLLLLVLLFWVRSFWTKKSFTKFRGQIFFIFTFAYGVVRFALEVLRDDVERGSYGPEWGRHILIPGSLLLMSLGFIFGISLVISNTRIRTVARVVSLIPAVVSYTMLRPESFGHTQAYQLSTSQWIALFSSLAVSYFYAQFWKEARKSPEAAMLLGEGAGTSSTPRETEEEEDHAEEEEGDKAPETT